MRTAERRITGRGRAFTTKDNFSYRTRLCCEHASSDDFQRAVGILQPFFPTERLLTYCCELRPAEIRIGLESSSMRIGLGIEGAALFVQQILSSTGCMISENSSDAPTFEISIHSGPAMQLRGMSNFSTACYCAALGQLLSDPDRDDGCARDGDGYDEAQPPALRSPASAPPGALEAAGSPPARHTRMRPLAWPRSPAVRTPCGPRCAAVPSEGGATRWSSNLSPLRSGSIGAKRAASRSPPSEAGFWPDALALCPAGGRRIAGRGATESGFSVLGVTASGGGGACDSDWGLSPRVAGGGQQQLGSGASIARAPRYEGLALDSEGLRTRGSPITTAAAGIAGAVPSVVAVTVLLDAQQAASMPPGPAATAAPERTSPATRAPSAAAPPQVDPAGLTAPSAAGGRAAAGAPATATGDCHWARAAPPQRRNMQLLHLLGLEEDRQSLRLQVPYESVPQLYDSDCEGGSAYGSLYGDRGVRAPCLAAIQVVDVDHMEAKGAVAASPPVAVACCPPPATAGSAAAPPPAAASTAAARQGLCAEHATEWPAPRGSSKPYGHEASAVVPDSARPRHGTSPLTAAAAAVSTAASAPTPGPRQPWPSNKLMDALWPMGLGLEPGGGGDGGGSCGASAAGADVEVEVIRLDQDFVEPRVAALPYSIEWMGEDFSWDDDVSGAGVNGGNGGGTTARLCRGALLSSGGTLDLLYGGEGGGCNDCNGLYDDCGQEGDYVLLPADGAQTTPQLGGGPSAFCWCRMGGACRAAGAGAGAVAGGRVLGMPPLQVVSFTTEAAL